MWVGGKGGDAPQAAPAPVARLRQLRVPARGVQWSESHRIEWRPVAEIGNVEAMLATVQTDLAVTAALPSTLPPGLDILMSESGLPPLPTFAINLHLPRSGTSDVALAMARAIREGFVGRQRQAA